MSNVTILESMIGDTFIAFQQDAENIVFIRADGTRASFYHDQDCCECVQIDDIVGDLEDLIKSPILMAEEVSNVDNHEGSVGFDYDSFTWTFYKFATIKGYVTVKWLGYSNGYYSERVSFYDSKEKPL